MSDSKASNNNNRKDNFCVPNLIFKDKVLSNYMYNHDKQANIHQQQGYSKNTAKHCID